MPRAPGHGKKHLRPAVDHGGGKLRGFGGVKPVANNPEIYVKVRVNCLSAFEKPRQDYIVHYRIFLSRHKANPLDAQRDRLHRTRGFRGGQGFQGNEGRDVSRHVSLFPLIVTKGVYIGISRELSVQKKKFLIGEFRGYRRYNVRQRGI
jgi:hypothetical protein